MFSDWRATDCTGAATTSPATYYTRIFHNIYNIYTHRVGRRPVLAVTMAVYAVFGLVRLYVTSIMALMVTTFIASTSFPPMLELSLIIGE